MASIDNQHKIVRVFPGPGAAMLRAASLSLFLAVLAPVAGAIAGDAPETPAGSVQAGEIVGDGLDQSLRPEVGMSLEEALALIGSSPDSEQEIGAACGMLDVLTWDEEGTKIISVDGTVTSIVKGR